MKRLLTNLELSIFSRQLALVLHSGISLSDGLLLLQEDCSEQGFAELFHRLCDTLELTGDFSEALSEAGCFPDYFIRMVKIGECSGTMEDILQSLSDYYQRQDTLLGSLRDALIYPLILLGMLTAVLAVLIRQVMPVFADVFRQLGLNLSGMAQSVFQISDLLQRFSAIFLCFLIAAALFTFYALHSARLKASLPSFLRRLPFIKTILLQMARARFAHALALTLHSGLAMDEGFSLAAMLTQEQLPAKQLALAEELLAQGNDLGSVLKESGIFSGLDASMIAVGFRTGTAETILLRIFHSSQQEAEETIQRTIGLVEPTLTAVLSIFTGMILISVMLPLLSVMSGIG